MISCVYCIFSRVIRHVVIDVKRPLRRLLLSCLRSVICDPIHRLLSDFKHVTYDWGGDKPNRINRQFLGPDSVLYPFQNMTFDQMIAKYLPMMQHKNATDHFYKKYHEVFDMIGNGKFGWTIQHYKGGEFGNGMFQTKGSILVFLPFIRIGSHSYKSTQMSKIYM